MARAKADMLNGKAQTDQGHGEMARAQPSQFGSAILTFTTVIEPEEEGGYVVTFPAIPDLATQGETLAEARLMAEECLRGYIEVLRETGRPPPAPGATTPSKHATIVELQIAAG